MKHAARVASQFIHGSEAFIGGNNMIFMLTFRDPYDCTALCEAFQQLVRQNKELQRSYSDFQWTYCQNVEQLLAGARQDFERLYTDDELLNAYNPTGSALPIRLLRLDETRIGLLLNHIFNNGATSLGWVERLLSLYSGEPFDSSKPQPAPSRTGILAVFQYLATFLWRAGDAAQTTVDLSDGRTPTARPNYSSRVWRFSERETAALVGSAKSAGLTVTEALTLWLAESFFEARPQHTRVCVSVPTDLSQWAQPDEPGNHTGSLIIQLFRGPNLNAQVKAAFQWARHAVHLWLPQMLGFFATDRALFAQFQQKATQPIPKLAPFENFTFAASSVGVIRGRLANRYLSEISACMKTNSILLVAMTLSGRMNWRVAIAEGLFQPEEAFGVIDRVARRFAETTLPSSSAHPEGAGLQTSKPSTDPPPHTQTASSGCP